MQPIDLNINFTLIYYKMNTNINKGVDPFRIQTGEPPYFVNWQKDGQNQYKFFNTVFAMYKFLETLKN